MPWEKHFQRRGTNTDLRMVSVPMETENFKASHGTSAKFSSYLPEVYAGHTHRIPRYYQYDEMNRDSDINAALDTIADFCTQSEEQNDNPFDVKYNEEANETEVNLIKEALNKWTKLNDFRRRIWKIVRDTAQNGDAFFLRDPETHEWLWLDHTTVQSVAVDSEDDKKINEYLVSNLTVAKQGKFGSTPADMSQYRSPFGGPAATAGSRPAGGAGNMSSQFQMAGADRDPRKQRNSVGGTNEISVIDANHVVHLSLCADMDINWPFGSSILDPIFKVYRQKELLEDAVIIYRVQRAPERRVFYIDCGTMNPIKAKSHVESIKNEIHQRRIPNRTGGGASIIDAAYNPLTILEDYFFAQTNEGRGSKVETLPGGEMVGEIGDLLHFSKKMARGLRIPTSYLSLGDDEGGVSYNDGKLGAAMIQEFRFNKYCMRIQSMLAPVFDREFKLYMRECGIEIEWSLFDLQFNPPQNFTKYRQIEVDTQQVSVYGQVSQMTDISKRFAKRKYLGWSEDDLIENETLWKEENADRLRKTTGSTPAESEPQGDLSSVGVRGGGDDFGMDGEMMPDDGMGEEMPADGSAPPPGDMGGAPGGAPAPGAAPPPPGKI